MSERTEATGTHERTEDRDGMRVTWHAPIGVDDGIVLRADVYRPIDDGRPVILTYGGLRERARLSPASRKP